MFYQLFAFFLIFLHMNSAICLESGFSKDKLDKIVPLHKRNSFEFRPREQKTLPKSVSDRLFFIINATGQRFDFETSLHKALDKKNVEHGFAHISPLGTESMMISQIPEHDRRDLLISVFLLFLDIRLLDLNRITVLILPYERRNWRESRTIGWVPAPCRSTPYQVGGSPRLKVRGRRGRLCAGTAPGGEPARTGRWIPRSSRGMTGRD